MPQAQSAKVDVFDHPDVLIIEQSALLDGVPFAASAEQIVGAAPLHGRAVDRSKNVGIRKA